MLGNMCMYKLLDYLIDMNWMMEKLIICGCFVCLMRWDIRVGLVVNINFVVLLKKGLVGLMSGVNLLNF